MIGDRLVFLNDSHSAIFDAQAFNTHCCTEVDKVARGHVKGTYVRSCRFITSHQLSISIAQMCYVVAYCVESTELEVAVCSVENKLLPTLDVHHVLDSSILQNKLQVSELFGACRLD